MINSAVLKPLNGKQDSDFNLNQTENEVVYDVGPFASYSVQVVPNGAWSTAVLTLSRSNDGNTPYALEEGATTIGPGAAITSSLSCLCFGRLHVRLTTLEGGAASCRIIVHAKDASLVA